MAEHVAKVQTCHGHFGDDHLEEGTESREDAEFIFVESETCGGTEVAALHD